MHRLWAWFETNKKQAGIAVAIVAAAGLVMWFVSWRRDQRDINAGEAVSAVSLAQTVQGGVRPDAAEAYLRVASDYANTSSGARALLLAAGTFFSESKYDQALKSFQRFTREHRDSPWMGEALLGTASCQEVLGKTNEAAVVYQDIKDHHSGDVVAAQAKFSLARIYEAQNKPELARPLYEDLARNGQYSSIGSEAGIRLEELMARSAAPVVETQAPAPVAPVMVTPAVPAPSNAVPFKLEER